MAATQVELFTSSTGSHSKHHTAEHNEPCGDSLMIHPGKLNRLCGAQSAKLITCFTGIFASYLTFGIVQESM